MTPRAEYLTTSGDFYKLNARTASERYHHPPERGRNKEGPNMITVKQMLEEKGNAVWTITPDAKVFDALKLMAEKEVGALIVLEKGAVVGIISERDYARKIALMGRLAQDTPVKEIMTLQINFVHPSSSSEECMALMTDKRIRHLPVIEKNNLVGVVSIGDIVKAIIGEQEVMIGHLQDYIMGKYQ
jgi:CBS domain-containing protein